MMTGSDNNPHERDGKIMGDFVARDGKHYHQTGKGGRDWHYVKTCHHCGEEFNTTYAAAKYCTGRCRMAAFRGRTKQDTRCYCQWCGRAFLAKRGDAKYDSRACQQAAYRARKAAGKQLMF